MKQEKSRDKDWFLRAQSHVYQLNKSVLFSMTLFIHNCNLLCKFCPLMVSLALQRRNKSSKGDSFFLLWCDVCPGTYIPTTENMPIKDVPHSKCACSQKFYYARPSASSSKLRWKQDWKCPFRPRRIHHGLLQKKVELMARWPSTASSALHIKLKATT